MFGISSTIGHSRLVPNKFVWKWSADKVFSSSSAYNALFLARFIFSGLRSFGRFEYRKMQVFWLVDPIWSLLEIQMLSSAWSTS
jgi:hypothetical protein